MGTLPKEEITGDKGLALLFALIDSQTKASLGLCLAHVPESVFEGLSRCLRIQMNSWTFSPSGQGKSKNAMLVLPTVHVPTAFGALAQTWYHLKICDCSALGYLTGKVKVVLMVPLPVTKQDSVSAGMLTALRGQTIIYCSLLWQSDVSLPDLSSYTMWCASTSVILDS